MKKLSRVTRFIYLTSIITLFVGFGTVYADRSWSPPDQTGHAGQFLETDGVNTLWATAGGGGSGTVTSISAGTGITLSTNPCTTTCTVSLTNGTSLHSINDDVTAAQSLVTGTSGTNFTIDETGGGTHVFNLPVASATNTGKLSNTDWSTFNSKESALTFTSPLIRSTNIISLAGLSGLGSANRIIGMNNAGTAYEYKTVSTSGTAVSNDVGVTLSGANALVINLPTASATVRGVLSSTDWSTFNSKFNLPSLTSGSVLFSNGTTITQDNSNFFYDSTNHFLGIGTAAPAAELHVVSASTSNPRGVIQDQYTTDALGARYNIRKARGTMASPTTIVTADILGRMEAWGYDGSNFIDSGRITFGSEGTIAATSIPSYIAFSTGTNAAPTVVTEAMRIDSSQNVGIGKSPAFKLDVLGSGTTALSIGAQIIGGTSAASGGFKIGSYASAAGAIWSSAATPSITNYALYADSTQTALNAASALFIDVNGAAKITSTTTNLLFAQTNLTGSQATNSFKFAQMVNTSGAPSVFQIAITEAATPGVGTKYLEVLGGASATTSLFSVSNLGNGIFSNNITAGATAGMIFNGRSYLSSPVNNNLMISNNAGNDFGLLQFGGTTSSFPALKRSTTGLIARLADDSANAPFTSSNLTSTAKVTECTTVSSAGTLNVVSTCVNYVATGTTTTWTLDAVTGNAGVRMTIKNRGSGAITLNSNAGGNDIYTTSGVATLTINPGESYLVIGDGTFWLAE